MLFWYGHKMSYFIDSVFREVYITIIWILSTEDINYKDTAGLNNYVYIYLWYKIIQQGYMAVSYLKGKCWLLWYYLCCIAICKSLWIILVY